MGTKGHLQDAIPKQWPAECKYLKCFEAPTTMKQNNKAYSDKGYNIEQNDVANVDHINLNLWCIQTSRKGLTSDPS